MTYCKGKFCHMSDLCAHHIAPNETLINMVDWSVEGSGSASELGTESTPYCGPHSEPPYAKFESGIAFDTEDVDYKREYTSAFTPTEPQPCSIEIVNCNHISVGLKDFGVDVDLPPDYFAQIDKIIINGIAFNRERGKI